MKNKYSTGIDEIPITVIKGCLNIIAPILSIITNNSIQQGIFPDKLKCSLVKPFHKSNRKSDVENYRPITIPSVFSKIMETVIIKKSRSHLTMNNIITDQHGFLKGRSTVTSLKIFVIM